VGFYPFSGGQLPNFQGKSPGIFPSDHSNGWHFLMAKKPKDIIQQSF
jgi:hypothetical protein